MANWHNVLAHVGSNVEDHFDQLKYRLKYRLRGLGPINLIAYNGYGRADRLYIKGRVLEDKGELDAQENDHLWNNLVNMYRRMESDEVPHARIRLRFQSYEQEIVADEEGYFEAWIEPPAPLHSNQPWQEVQLELIEPLPAGQSQAVTATARVLVPPPTARFGVISDIDDTVVKSDATHLLRMARNVFMGNARTRLPFPGVAAFYRALLDGLHGNDLNPLFFISSSPWNLYGLLVDFFRLQNIPLSSVILLRDWGLSENEILPVKNRAYKIEAIQRILDFYPQLPFILIGDSGQEDPEIYQEIVDTNPGRVLAVYIRNVSRNLKRPESIRLLAEKIVEDGSSLLLADDTLSIARHAAAQGWIAEQTLAGIEREKSKDEAPPNPVEKLLGEDLHGESGTVIVEGESRDETVGAINQGGIEAALSKGEQQKQKPPTVIVKSDTNEPSPEGKNQTGKD